MHHCIHNYAVVQHLVAKLPMIINIRHSLDKKHRNSLKLRSLLKITSGDEIQ